MPLDGGTLQHLEKMGAGGRAYIVHIHIVLFIFIFMQNRFTWRHKHNKADLGTHTHKNQSKQMSLELLLKGAGSVHIASYVILLPELFINHFSM